MTPLSASRIDLPRLSSVYTIQGAESHFDIAFKKERERGVLRGVFVTPLEARRGYNPLRMRIWGRMRDPRHARSREY